MELYNGAAHSSDFRAGDADDLLLSFSSGCLYDVKERGGGGEVKPSLPVCLVFSHCLSLSLECVYLTHTMSSALRNSLKQKQGRSARLSEA